MTGYVAMARVERGRVRALAWDGPPPAHADAHDEGPVVAPASGAALEPDDAISLGEQLERLREQLGMVTFYLTDPESWR